MWLVVVVLASLHIISIRNGPKWLFYVSKPLPLLLMIGILITSEATHLPYTQWILLGLSLSLFGDILLMLHRNKSLLGFSAFYLAHLSYCFSFALISAWHITPWLPVATFGLGGCIYMFFRPSLGKQKLPVAIYILVLMAMSWMALEYYLSGQTQSSSFAILGCLLFVISGMVLAFGRFDGQSIFSRQVVMVTYYSAQTLITMSVIAIVIRTPYLTVINV
ncbi:lysoplasmalogenase [Vibrio natriegens]|uniref:lysoplasmalogenase n=1 Tax=Vibrio natriegens TaxID=691 RepID=UPI0021E8EA71|nr:lysoplasmalogenase [Vibrio natriegens]UYI49606.1 lysoplasmalogenase [Vibrio natriegens]